MTPNEKELLEKFKGLGEANVISLGRQIGQSLDYTKQLCKSLMNKGFLEEVTSGDRVVYRLKNKEEVKKEVVPNQIHPLWLVLMDYVRENGGHLKMNIRFKDGIPVEADDIKKKTRFDIKYQLDKNT